MLKMFLSAPKRVRKQRNYAFMAEKRDEFAVGRRHLANMMGVDHNTFTQKDIDEAIEYLLPSGLFVPAARPLMRPPEEVFPPKKDAEFDDYGRPFHTLFYTAKPNYYQLLHDMTENIVKLNRYEDTMISKNIQPDPNIKIELTGSSWIPKEKIELQLVEQISDKMYANLIEVLDRVISHPYSYTIRDEIEKYRLPFMSTSLSSFVDPGVVQYDDEGRAFVKIEGLKRKSATGSVTVYRNGSGKILINGKDLSYFNRMQSREQVLFPLQFSGLLNEVDVEASVQLGGSSSQAGVVRLGIAMAVKHFVDPSLAEQMRLAGLLTPDVRTRERKKFGQMKARRKYTWKKR